MSVDGSLGATTQGGAFELKREHAHERAGEAAVSYRSGTVAMVALPLLGLLICVAATKTNTLLPQSVRPAPNWMAGPFHFIGFTLTSGEVIIATLAMFLAYAVAVRYADLLSPRRVIWAIAIFNVVALIGPPLISTDVFSYQAYARMFIDYGTNPYLHGPSVIQLDPIYPFIGAKWIYTPSVYGPLFTLLSGIWANTSVAINFYIFKAIAGLACAGTLFLIWRSAAIRGVNQARAVALFGLNPLVVVYGVGGGHNDLLTLLLTTAGVYAMLTNRARTTGATIVGGSLIKLTGGLLLPFTLLAEAPNLPIRRQRLRILCGAAAVGLAFAIAGFVVFGTGLLHMPTTLSQVQEEGGWQSIPGLVFTVAHIPVTHAGDMAFELLFFSYLCWLLWRVWRGRMNWIAGAAWATLAMILTAGSVLPWYISWPLPLVALCSDRRLWRCSIGLTMVVGVLTCIQFLPTGIPFLGL